MVRIAFNRKIAWLLMWSLLGWLAMSSLYGQQPAEEISSAIVKKHLEEISSDAKLEAEKKNKLTTLYRQALEYLAAAQKWQQQAQVFSETEEKAPRLLQAIKQNAAKAKSDAKRQIIKADTSLAQLELMLARADARYKAAEKEHNQLLAEVKVQNERRIEIPKLLTAAQQQLQKIKLQLTASEKQQGDAMDQANQIVALAQQKSLVQEINSYEKEIGTYDIRAELLAARRDRASGRLSRLKKRLEFWQAVVNKRRKEETSIAARQARDKASNGEVVPEVIRQLHQENAALAELRAELAAKIEAVGREQQKITAQLQQLASEFSTLQEKIKVAGQSGLVGVLLRKKWGTIPRIDSLRNDIERRQDEIPTVQLKLIELEEARSNLVNLDELSKKTGAAAASGVLPDKINAMIKERLTAKRNYIEALLKDYDNYLGKLLELVDKEQQFAKETSTYSAYIEERIFWVRSMAGLSLSDAQRAWIAWRWLFVWTSWQSVWLALSDDLGGNYWLYAIAILGFAGLFYLQRFCYRHLQHIASLTVKIKTDEFILTIETLFLTMVLAILWPALLWFIAWRLSATSASTDFLRSVAIGLRHVALVYLAIALLRSICIDNGLAQAHFRWDNASMRLLRRNLLWLLLAGLPIVFIVNALEWQAGDIWKDALGRLAFVIGMVVLTVFLAWMMLPKGKIMQQVIFYNYPSPPQHWSYSLYTLALAIPIALAVTAACGYYFTALQLTSRLRATLLLLALILFGYALVTRWLYFIRRTLALMKANRFRLAKNLPLAPVNPPAPPSESPANNSGAPEAKKTQSDNAIASDPARMIAPEDLNIPSVMLQARRILVTIALLSLLFGLWHIWNDVFPAFKILTKIKLWNSGNQTVNSGHLLAAVAMALLTIIASKNLPGLLELAILQRLHTEKSTRFAIVTLFRYSLILVGIIVSFQMIGIDWGKVQWLAAAFTVGLGFGLQEIFANFVSGLIILFERPIRVGDVVTIGDTSGTVSKIKIRATTITDWNRKELVVPNKEFITGRLINWTLTDTILRLNFPVGLAYGSNTDLAEELLLQAAKEREHVLSDPAPYVIFKGFGDSTLEFELRLYIPSLDYYFETTHHVYKAIDHKLRQAKIVIAFPQRDVHIIASDASKMEMHT